jgi:hypothetical protein
LRAGKPSIYIEKIKCNTLNIHIEKHLIKSLRTLFAGIQPSGQTFSGRTRATHPDEYDIMPWDQPAYLRRCVAVSCKYSSRGSHMLHQHSGSNDLAEHRSGGAHSHQQDSNTLFIYAMHWNVKYKKMRRKAMKCIPEQQFQVGNGRLLERLDWHWDWGALAAG